MSDRRYGFGRVLLVAALACAPGCDTAEPTPEPIRLVRVEPVFVTGGSRVRTFAGSAQASLESRLSFKVPGTIRRLNAKVGDRVRAGQLLAEIDPRDYELQVQDAEAALRQARARARNSEAVLERVRGLYENNNASQTEYDAARADHDAASAQGASLEKKLALARSQLEYTRLTSPLEGAISNVAVEANENVGAGQTVATLTAGRRLEVQIGIPEAFIGRIREGQEVSVSFDALPGETLAAVVTQVGVASTGMATTYPVTARLIEEAPGVRPGMAAEVSIRFESGDGQSRILVPPFAIGEDRNGRFAFVARQGDAESAVVIRREVRVGELTGEGLEILDGLEDGDLIVTAGVSRLRDGMEVRLPSGSEVGR